MKKSYYKLLPGEICYLSPIDADDAEQYCKWFNDLSMTMNLDPSIAVTPEEERQIIADLKKNARIFGIIDNKTDKLIGGAGLHSLDQYHRTATFGVYIGESSQRGMGYGTEATRLTIDYGFNVLNLHNIDLMVYNYNDIAVHVYEKVGFRKIGIRREARFFGGELHDMILMDIIPDDFESPFVKQLIRKR